MLGAVIQWLETTVLPLGAPGVFAAGVIEEIIAIIPSSIVQMGAGFLFLSGMPVGVDALVRLLTHVILPASLGVVVGSLPIYYAAYYGGKPVIDKFGRFVGVGWTDIEQAQQKFTETSREELFIFICRALPIMPSVVITTFSGIVRVRVGTYLLYTFLGTLVRAAILGVLGWQLGALYREYAPQIDRLEKVGLLIVLMSGGVYYLYLRTRKTK
jgi:membrane protein DedA with SNARE-associated domain